MEIFNMAGQMILALSILIVLHEWGHFQTARWFGIKVEKFYLFFDAWGKKLFKFKKGDTEYGIGWLPLGGYVKIAGMIDESMDKDFLEKDAQPYEFRSKPAWQRLIVMIGGVTVNAILGMLIFTVIALTWGVSYMPIENVKHGIVTYEYGKECGFKDGDVVIKANGQTVERWSDVLNADLILSDNATFTVSRGGEEVLLQMPEDFAKRLTEGRGEGMRSFISRRNLAVVGDNTKAKAGDGNNSAKIGLEKGDLIVGINEKDIKYYDEFVKELQELKGKQITLEINREGSILEKEATISDEGKVGVVMGTDLERKRDFYSFGGSVAYGAKTALGSITETIQAFKQIFRGKLDASESLSGPLQIATIFGGTWDWESFWTLTGRLSMILAFMNILPIPALDGGHVFFILIEMGRGKPLSDKALERAQIVGFVILAALMLFIFGNDIYQMFIR